MNLGNNEYKPLSFWSWNGAMQEAEIRWQIREFTKSGFGGFFIHSRAGRTIPYMEEEWFAACGYAIDEAKACGLDVWLYDEDGWPSGFAGGLVNGCGEEYCGKSLQFGVGYTAKADTRLLAAYRQVGADEYRRIPVEQATEEDLYCWYQIVPHYVDIMSEKVIAKFLAVTHERYRAAFGSEFGGTIKGIFTDEPQLAGSPSWSTELEQKDLLDDLWLLQVDGSGYQEFRYRYWELVNGLIQKNFAGQIQEWCDRNHLIFTGHFSSEDGLIYQTLSNGGVMPLYKNMGIPGIDHLGNRYASPVLMKQVTSVAHQQNQPYVLSESFGCAGWDVSFKELLGIVGWQAVFGVNTFCTHLSAYSIEGRRKRDYPAFYSYQEPWWEDTHLLFGAVERLCRTISESRRDTRVAVLHPIRSIWRESGCKHEEKGKELAAQFRQLLENLLDIHIDFDLVDEGEILPEQVGEEGNLQVGSQTYHWLILPEMQSIAEDTVRTISRFSECGGNVICINRKPDAVEGVELQNRRGILQKYFRANPVQTDYQILDAREENEVTGIVAHYGITREGAVAYLFNHQVGHDIEVVFRQKGDCRIELVNLIDGSTSDVTHKAFSVPERSGVLLRITKQEEVIGEEPLSAITARTMLPVKISPSEWNALTIDQGRYAVDGGEWSEKKAVIHMLDEIYEKISRLEQGGNVQVEYVFATDFQKKPSHLMLAAETNAVREITVNGQQVAGDGTWWLDKCIHQYDITEAVQPGENTVVLTYEIASAGQGALDQEAFETERNRFFYKVEPESVYIRGDFDVVRKEGSFVLQDGTPKRPGDLTTQGMYFYRGNCRYEGEIIYDGVKSVTLLLDDMRAIGAKVIVNDLFAGFIFAKEGVELTPYLKDGQNRIVVELLGHNRNLLGPHHHIHEKLYFVGPNSFDGTWGFADFVSPDIAVGSSTWTEAYSFAPFGVGQIIIKEERTYE